MTKKRKVEASEPHEWEFKARFRKGSFGWKSQPAITRIKQAVKEIKKVSKKDAVLAGEGAVLFLERVSPAIASVDSSSGSIGTAVNRAIAELVPIIADAPVESKTREEWLERLFEAYMADRISYIEVLGEYWGDLCASKDVASSWADRLSEAVRQSRSQATGRYEYFHASTNCLSALLAAERHEEVLALLSANPYPIWQESQFGVKALAALGRIDEALRYAEEKRGSSHSSQAIASTCEDVLLSAGRIDEAYRRFGIEANEAGTYLAWFRAVAKKYPHKAAREILADLVEFTPGDEGKWFAAAKEAGLFEEAIALAARTPCDPKTLARAAGDFAKIEPTFAIDAGLLSLHWINKGYGYDLTGLDVYSAYRATIDAAEVLGTSVEVKDRIRTLVAESGTEGFVARSLRRELGR